MSSHPRTAAGRALLADLTMGYDPKKGEETGDIVMPAVYEGMTKDILAIEAEAASAAIWERLEAQPGFNEEMREAETDLEAGRGTPFREAEAATSPDPRLRELADQARLVSQWHGAMNSGPLEELDAELGALGQKARTILVEPAAASDPLRERLAALEHEQWAAWANTLLGTEPISEERKGRWLKLIAVPYSELTEAQKEADRDWADKVLAILQEPAADLDDSELAEHLAVAIAAAGNPSQYKNVGEHARAIVTALRRYESRGRSGEGTP